MQTSAWAFDCGDGTIAANYRRFHSSEFAGRLAIAPWAQNSAQAKHAQLNCVLNAPVVHVRKRLNRIYFVFNNMVTNSAADVETSFIGLEVERKLPTGQFIAIMRREGRSWQLRNIDHRYPRRTVIFSGANARNFSLLQREAKPGLSMVAAADESKSASSAERAFAKDVDASLFGAVQPKPGFDLQKTWDERYRFSFMQNLAREPYSAGEAVTCVWISFEQRSTRPSFLVWPKRVATEVRVGDATKIDVHLFGSNAEIPELRYHVIFY